MTLETCQHEKIQNSSQRPSDDLLCAVLVPCNDSNHPDSTLKTSHPLYTRRLMLLMSTYDIVAHQAVQTPPEVDEIAKAREELTQAHLCMRPTLGSRNRVTVHVGRFSMAMRTC
eukprot:6473589-Amphidinium_carterae.1